MLVTCAAFMIGDTNVIIIGVSVGLSSVVSSAVVMILVMALCGYQKRRKRAHCIPGKCLGVSLQ